MRIRTIKPEFFLHDGIFDAEREECLPLRIAYIGLWCAADREGRFKWEPRRLGASIVPYDGLDFSRVLDALVTRGFIVKYTVGGDTYGEIPSFRRHQVINPRERKSEIPERAVGETVTHASGTRGSRVATGDDLARGEGKGREGKGVSRPDACTPTPSPCSSTLALRGEQQRSLPADIDTPEVRAAWDKWCEYCFERNYNRPPSLHTMDEHIKALLKIGAARAPEAITNAISKQLPVPCLPFSGPPGGRTAPTTSTAPKPFHKTPVNDRPTQPE